MITNIDTKNEEMNQTFKNLIIFDFIYINIRFEKEITL